jgi:hypothetical protein
MPHYNYDLIEIKESLTIDQVKELVDELGGESFIKNNTIVSKTICHCGDTHKLYYYDNTHLFRCYTGGCDEPTFDIFELIRKIKSRESNEDYQLPQAVEYVAQYFGFSQKNNLEEDTFINKDLTYIENYDRINNIELESQIVELKSYEDNFLKNLPHPIIEPWVEDNITPEVMDYYEICYDPKNQGIVIPHRDINGRLIGVRERTLIKENAEKYGKYLPMRVGNKMYNHPLSFNLYGLYQNEEHIKAIKKAIVLESEKSVLQYATMFGQENNIAVSMCGSNLINYQAWLLMNLGVNEIVVGLDHDFRDVNSEEAKRKIRNLKTLHKKYGKYVNISFIWDKEHLTGHKSSPTDCGKDIFLELFNRRISIYT